MVKVAVKKRGRPAKKKPVGRPPKKKVGRPRKVKEPVAKPETMRFEYDHLRQVWSPEITLQELNKLVAKLTLRVNSIEFKIQQAETAGAKIQADLEEWRTKTTPKWIPRVPSDGKPNVRYAKVKVMLRNGQTLDAHAADYFTWGELGDRTIIAYAVV